MHLARIAARLCRGSASGVHDPRDDVGVGELDDDAVALPAADRECTQRACSMPVSGLKETDEILTIEGLTPDASHPVQRAWAALDVPQCGYCQSGQIMAAVALLKEKPKPTDADIDAAMTNICRCGTYQRIRDAIHMAAGSTEPVKTKT